MKNVKRAFTLFLLAALLLPLFAGCVSKEPEETLPETVPAKLIPLIEGGKTKFVLIRPDECDQNVVSASSKLRKAMEAATGASIDFDSDFVRKGQPIPEDTFEILFGATNRPETQKVLSEIGEGEYRFVLASEKRLVIVGSNDYGTIRAADAFIRDVLLYDESTDSYGIKDLKLEENFTMIGYSSPYHGSTAQDGTLGLRIGEDGTILLGGVPFYGIGMNWHGGFLRQLGNENLADYFKVLEENHIPFLRTMMGVFYPADVDRWYKHKDNYFKKMDRFVENCENHHVGLIPSMMWNLSCFCEYNKESVNALADPDSKSSMMAKEYVTDLVTRYKDSPAIWGWEVGNEGNLGADVSELTTATLTAYYKMIADVIYAIDPSRLITGGDSYPRAPSKALREKGQWSPNDSDADVMETFGLYTPAPMNTISVHLYGSNDEKGLKHAIDTFRTKTRVMGIGGFVGEFGQGDWIFDNDRDKIPATDPREAKEQEKWKGLVDMMLDADIQLMAAWSFGRYIEQVDGTSIEYGMYNGIYQNAYQMDYIREKNIALKEQGKNVADDYWAKVGK